MDRFRLRFRLLYNNSVAPALGGAFAVGTNTMALIQTCQIQAIMTVPQRLSFFAQLSNCNLVTCWHIELSILGLVHLSISIHWRNSFTCSITFFSFEKSLGLALGESCHIQGSPLRPFPRVAGLSLAPLILSHLRLSLTCAYHVSLAPPFLSHLRLLDWCGFTHVHTCNVTRVQSATEWTASVHTLHMSTPVM